MLIFYLDNWKIELTSKRFIRRSLILQAVLRHHQIWISLGQKWTNSFRR